MSRSCLYSTLSLSLRPRRLNSIFFFDFLSPRERLRELNKFICTVNWSHSDFFATTPVLFWSDLSFRDPSQLQFVSLFRSFPDVPFPSLHVLSHLLQPKSDLLHLHCPVIWVYEEKWSLEWHECYWGRISLCLRLPFVGEVCFFLPTREGVVSFWTVGLGFRWWIFRFGGSALHFWNIRFVPWWSK